MARPRARKLWFSSYLQTYIERDVRSVTAIRDLPTFRRLMSLVASRHGQTLNRSDLAAPLGMSVPGITAWLNVLEATAQILLVPPYFENLGKRLVKSPKLYVLDSGLACHLLGIESQAELERSPFLGALFEGFVAGEIVKAQLEAGRQRQIFHFRDRQGLEVDFVVPGKDGVTDLIEAKASRSPRPEMARPISRLTAALLEAGRGKVKCQLVHRSARGGATSQPLGGGVQAVPIEEFVGTR